MTHSPLGSAPRSNAGTILDTPLATASRADEITDRLVTAIAIGEYLPGSKLPSERELAASLRVGRMTVRAAIARLVVNGMLTTERGRGGGSFVCEQRSPASNAAVQRTLLARWEEMSDICEAAGRLQGTIAQAAAERRTAADVDQLQIRLDAFRAADSGEQSQHADSLLHVAICAAAHNVTLQSVLLDLESRISIVAPTHLWGSIEGMRAMEARSLADHEAIVLAICEQRAVDAGVIAREHARIDFELLEDALQRAAGGG